MNNKSLKQQAKEILLKHLIKDNDTKTMKKFKMIVDYTDYINAMITFAKLACEEQKKRCADEALIEEIDIKPYSIMPIYEYVIDKESILNAPLPKLE